MQIRSHKKESMLIDIPNLLAPGCFAIPFLNEILGNYRAGSMLLHAFAFLCRKSSRQSDTLAKRAAGARTTVLSSPSGVSTTALDATTTAARCLAACAMAGYIIYHISRFRKLLSNANALFQAPEPLHNIPNERLCL